MKRPKANISHDKLWRTFPLMLLYLLLLALPCCLKIGEHGELHFAKSWLLVGVVSSIFPATVGWLISFRSKWGKVLISLVLWTLFVADLFLFFHFETRITDRIIFLILQTNSREVGEFFSTYIFTRASLKVAVVAVALAIVYALLKKYGGKVRWTDKIQKRFKLGMIVANILSVITIALFAFTNVLNNIGTNNTIQGAIVACKNAGAYRADVSRLEKAMNCCDSEIDTSIYDLDSVPDVIFIIGESYNPNHSPLYGYKLMTTPGLVNEFNKGNLSVFADAVTPFPATGKMMEVLYSPAEAYAGSDRWDIPLVPSLFKHAGYIVTIHDNQCTRIVGDSKWDIGNCQFLNSNVVENASMDYRNKDIMTDDLKFCQRELSTMQMIKDERKSPMFSIIHLYGQHSPASCRYPSGFTHFTKDDYKWRKDITENQAEEIACYDNATLYNDSVVCTVLSAVSNRDAVVVYVADHGEEVHDYRNQYGRTYGPITRGVADNIYHVPLLIYTTPTFRRLHAAVAQQIDASLNHKVFVGDVPQMLLCLGGLKTRWRDASRNPLGLDYTSASRRILQGEIDYDAIQ